MKSVDFCKRTALRSQDGVDILRNSERWGKRPGSSRKRCVSEDLGSRVHREHCGSLRLRAGTSCTPWKQYSWFFSLHKYHYTEFTEKKSECVRDNKFKQKGVVIEIALCLVNYTAMAEDVKCWGIIWMSAICTEELDRSNLFGLKINGSESN